MLVKIRSYTEREFKKLKKVELHPSISHSECELFIIEDKEHWKKHHTLVKHFKQNNGQYFSNKLYTIHALVDNKSILGIDELVLPSSLFAIDGEIQGYTMPFIEENFNLGVLLKSPAVSLNKKMLALQKIGHLLDKLMKLEGLEGSFYLGDIHEGNFIYDINKGIYRAVDLDSCKIGNNNPSSSQYLSLNRKLEDFPAKYTTFKMDQFISFFENNEETTILSYIYMILNTISGVKIHELSVEEYYSYLQYLKDKGVPGELIDMFSLIYTPSKNKIDIEILSDIPSKTARVLTYDSFKKGNNY